MMIASDEPSTAGSTDLMEASLKRILEHVQGRAFVLVTAWRAALDTTTNVRKMADLKRLIRADGHTFIAVEGIGPEESDFAREPSLIVLDRDDPADADGAFLIRALRWARAHGQHSIFLRVVRDRESLAAIVNVSSGESSIEQHASVAIGEFFAALRRHESFKHQWMGVKFADPAQNWIVGMGLEAQGQIRFDLCESVPTWRAQLRGHQSGSTADK